MRAYLFPICSHKDSVAVRSQAGLGGLLAIVTPFVAVRGSYDSLLADETAVGAGPGVSWRHWFREGQYAAPASYIDLSVGYQFGLSGGDRAEGVFLGINLNY